MPTAKKTTAKKATAKKATAKKATMKPAKRAASRPSSRRRRWGVEDGISPWGPNPHNDYVEVFTDIDGAWRWHRRDGRNDLIVASSAGDGYEDEGYARLAAACYCPGCPIR